MINDCTYFQVHGVTLPETGKTTSVIFDRGTVVGGGVYDLLPSAVVPSEELIKTSERSLDGSLNVDITAVKTSLSVKFDWLEDRDFTLVERIFDLGGQAEKYPDGITVEYFDLKGAGAKKTLTCFIDGLSFTPFVRGGEIAWRDVAVKLVEI